MISDSSSSSSSSTGSSGSSSVSSPFQPVARIFGPNGNLISKESKSLSASALTLPVVPMKLSARKSERKSDHVVKRRFYNSCHSCKCGASPGIEHVRCSCGIMYCGRPRCSKRLNIDWPLYSAALRSGSPCVHCRAFQDGSSMICPNSNCKQKKKKGLESRKYSVGIVTSAQEIVADKNNLLRSTTATSQNLPATTAKAITMNNPMTQSILNQHNLFTNNLNNNGNSFSMIGPTSLINNSQPTFIDAINQHHSQNHNGLTSQSQSHIPFNLTMNPANNGGNNTNNNNNVSNNSGLLHPQHQQLQLQQVLALLQQQQSQQSPSSASPVPPPPSSSPPLNQSSVMPLTGPTASLAQFQNLSMGGEFQSTMNHSHSANSQNTNSAFQSLMQSINKNSVLPFTHPINPNIPHQSMQQSQSPAAPNLDQSIINALVHQHFSQQSQAAPMPGQSPGLAPLSNDLILSLIQNQQNSQTQNFNTRQPINNQNPNNPQTAQQQFNSQSFINPAHLHSLGAVPLSSLSAFVSSSPPPPQQPQSAHLQFQSHRAISPPMNSSATNSLYNLNHFTANSHEVKLDSQS